MQNNVMHKWLVVKEEPKNGWVMFPFNFLYPSILDIGYCQQCFHNPYLNKSPTIFNFRAQDL